MKPVFSFIVALIVLNGICVSALGVGTDGQLYAEGYGSASDRGFFSVETSPNVRFDTDLALDIEKRNKSNENETVRVHLFNGHNATIKIMPETASATALVHIGMHSCSVDNNCTIVLKEVGDGDETRAAYEVRVHKRAKLFGIFATSVTVVTEVDAETGVVTKSHGPWWAFLTTSAEASARA